MSSVDRFNPRELLRFRYDLDIPAFVQTAVQHNLNKEEVLLYLHIITNTLDGTRKDVAICARCQAGGFNPQRDSRLASPLIRRTARPNASQPETPYPTRIC